MAAPTIQKTEQLIAHIIPCALTLFVRYGYKKTTADEIASCARISKKTLYEVFPSKEEILRETMWRETRKDIRVFEKTLSPGAKPDEVMHLLCRTVLTTKASETNKGPFWGLRSTDEHIWRTARDSMKRVFGAIYELGRQQGHFKPVMSGFASEIIMSILDAAEIHFSSSPDQTKRLNDTLSILADVIACKERLSFGAATQHMTP